MIDMGNQWISSMTGWWFGKFGLFFHILDHKWPWTVPSPQKSNFPNGEARFRGGHRFERLGQITGRQVVAMDGQRHGKLPWNMEDILEEMLFEHVWTIFSLVFSDWFIDWVGICGIFFQLEMVWFSARWVLLIIEHCVYVLHCFTILRGMII